jgi:DNA-directed RNA polymerase subunit RPC12/RpoP
MDEEEENDMTCAWNRCTTCGALVDVDDCVDGSEIDCGACDERLVVTEFTDDTWALIPVEFDSEVEQ